MQWTDDAIILSVRKFGENKALVRVFARTHGVYGAIVRAATSKSKRGILQPGNAVSVTWQARLAEQMGSFTVEPVTPFAAYVMQDRLKLAALSSACALMETALPERHPYPQLYAAFHAFLEPLADRQDWQAAYVQLELKVLAESGFGLDLEHCAATGQREDLTYVSPKSGRAVSTEAAAPYKDKLLPLPPFLTAKKTSASLQETLAGLRLSGYFLEHRLAEPHGRKLPAARQRLMSMMKAEYAETED